MQNRQHKLENLITGLVLIPGKGQNRCKQQNISDQKNPLKMSDGAAIKKRPMQHNGRFKNEGTVKRVPPFHTKSESFYGATIHGVENFADRPVRLFRWRRRSRVLWNHCVM
jgi:hypothetical protein